jgi:hypothetical protein
VRVPAEVKVHTVFNEKRVEVRPVVRGEGFWWSMPRNQNPIDGRVLSAESGVGKIRWLCVYVCMYVCVCVCVCVCVRVRDCKEKKLNKYIDR